MTKRKEKKYFNNDAFGFKKNNSRAKLSVKLGGSWRRTYSVVKRFLFFCSINLKKRCGYRTADACDIDNTKWVTSSRNQRNVNKKCVEWEFAKRMRVCVLWRLSLFTKCHSSRENGDHYAGTRSGDETRAEFMVLAAWLPDVHIWLLLGSWSNEPQLPGRAKTPLQRRFGSLPSRPTQARKHSRPVGCIKSFKINPKPQLLHKDD